jgi:hypothetical protein
LGSPPIRETKKLLRRPTMAIRRSAHLALALLCAAPLTLAAQQQDPVFQPVQPLSSSAEILISPTHPTASDDVRLHVVSYGFLFDVQHAARFYRSGATFTLDSTVGPLSPRPPEGPFAADIDLGVLPAGTYHVAIVNDLGTLTQSFTVAPAPAPPNPNVLSLDDGRFSVSLGRGTPSEGNLPLAPALQLSDLSGYFWFFDSQNAEVTVKLLDGSAVNGHFWLFAASMTDQPFTLQVIDTQCPTCPSKLYVSPAGKNQNFIDVEAFPK